MSAYGIEQLQMLPDDLLETDEEILDAFRANEEELNDCKRALAAAETDAERFMSRTIRKKDLRLTAELIPEGGLELIRPPFVELGSVQYLNLTTEDYVNLDSNHYRVARANTPRLILKSDVTLETACYPDAIKVEYKAGWERDEVPKDIVQGVITLAQAYHDLDDTDFKKYRNAAYNLLNRWRIVNTGEHF